MGNEGEEGDERGDAVHTRIQRSGERVPSKDTTRLLPGNGQFAGHARAESGGRRAESEILPRLRMGSLTGVSPILALGFQLSALRSLVRAVRHGKGASRYARLLWKYVRWAAGNSSICSPGQHPNDAGAVNGSHGCRFGCLLMAQANPARRSIAGLRFARPGAATPGAARCTPSSCASTSVGPSIIAGS